MRTPPAVASAVSLFLVHYLGIPLHSAVGSHPGTFEDEPYEPSPSVVEGTIAALEDPVTRVVVAALSDLGDWEVSSAVDEIASLAVDAHSQPVRLKSLDVLATSAESAAPVVGMLLPLSNDPSPSIRERLVKVIARSGLADDYQDEIAEMLEDRDSKVRCAAALGLGAAGERARQHLGDMLDALDRSQAPHEKACILNAVGDVGGLDIPEAQRLAPHLADRDEEVRIVAKAELLRVTALAHADGRRDELDALHEIAWREFQQSGTETQGVILGLALEQEAEAVAMLDEIAGRLDEDDPRETAAALHALAIAGEGALVLLPKAVGLSSHEAPEVRAAVIHALRGMGGKAVSQHWRIVTHALLDSDPMVRSEALLALPLAGSMLEQSKPILREEFPAASQQVRETLIRAVALKIRVLGPDPEILERVRVGLRSDDRELQIAGAYVACQLGDSVAPGLMPDFLALLLSEDTEVQGAAAVSLRTFDGSAENRERLREALAPLLDSADPKVRWAAMDTLDEAAPGRDPALLARIVALLEDPDRSVRNAALRAVGAAGPAARRYVREVVDTFLLDEDVPPFATVRALQRMSPLPLEDAALILGPACQGGFVSPMARLAAYQATGGSPDATLLLRLLGHSKLDLKDALAGRSPEDASQLLDRISQSPAAEGFAPQLKEEIRSRLQQLADL